MSGILIPLTQEQVECRYNEIGTNEEDVQKSLEILKEWYTQQPHLPKRYAFVGTFLRSFLLGCKNRIEIAKQKIDNFFYYRSLYPDYFVPRPLNDPSKKMYLLSRIYVFLPKCTPDGHRILMFKAHTDFTLDATFEILCLSMVLEILFLQDENPGGGIIIVCDCKPFTSFKALLRQIGLLKYYITLINLTPITVKKLIHMNAGKIGEHLVRTMNLVLTEKIRKRTLMVSDENISKLYDIVPKEILPVDYGGSEVSLDTLREKYYQKLLDMEDWFTNREFLMSDESKRPVDLKRNVENAFGAEGSFKTINVD